MKPGIKKPGQCLRFKYKVASLGPRKNDGPLSDFGAYFWPSSLPIFTQFHSLIPDWRPFHSSPNCENILFFLWMFNFFIHTCQIIWNGWRLVIFRIHFHISDWPEKCNIYSDWFSSKLKIEKKMQFIFALFHWLKLDLAILFRIRDHLINTQSK